MPVLESTSSVVEGGLQHIRRLLHRDMINVLFNTPGSTCYLDLPDLLVLTNILYIETDFTTACIERFNARHL